MVVVVPPVAPSYLGYLSKTATVQTVAKRLNCNCNLRNFFVFVYCCSCDPRRFFGLIYCRFVSLASDFNAFFTPSIQYPVSLPSREKAARGSQTSLRSDPSRSESSRSSSVRFEFAFRTGRIGQVGGMALGQVNKSLLRSGNQQRVFIAFSSFSSPSSSPSSSSSSSSFSIACISTGSASFFPHLPSVCAFFVCWLECDAASWA